jgi:hypothetical protein
MRVAQQVVRYGPFGVAAAGRRIINLKTAKSLGLATPTR